MLLALDSEVSQLVGRIEITDDWFCSIWQLRDENGILKSKTKSRFWALVYFSGPEIYFTKFWKLFKLVIWHHMLKLWKVKVLVDPGKVREGDGGLVRESRVRLIFLRLPLNRITLGHQKSDNNNRMIQLTDAFCVLLRYYGTSTRYLLTIWGWFFYPWSN